MRSAILFDGLLKVLMKEREDLEVRIATLRAAKRVFTEAVRYRGRTRQKTARPPTATIADLILRELSQNQELTPHQIATKLVKSGYKPRMKHFGNYIIRQLRVLCSKAQARRTKLGHYVKV